MRLAKVGFINAAGTRQPVRKRISPRGVPTALQGHHITTVSHPAAAESVMGKFLAPARIHIDPHHLERFELSLYAARLRDVTLAYLDVTCPYTTDIESTGDMFTVHLPTGGAVNFRIGAMPYSANPTLATVLSPGQRVTIASEPDSPQFIVRIERRAMERQLARLLGHSPRGKLTFEPHMELSLAHFSRWHSAISMVSGEIAQPDSLAQQGVGLGSLEELVISTLLHLQVSTASTELRGAPVDASRRHTLGQAIAYIEGHLQEPLTVGKIAEGTGMSVRTIQHAFRKDLDTTPMNYVREQRLERVRAELADAIPSDGIRVTDIALHWGFTHLGNFSRQYKQSYQELPSDTLRR
ncbi:AraC family transcriptional regulator [Micrococcales bacterium 31B]|nr:AraC family transcriptional regulator [Micrococcales bacterium 31B]